MDKQQTYFKVNPIKGFQMDQIGQHHQAPQQLEIVIQHVYWQVHQLAREQQQQILLVERHLTPICGMTVKHK